MMWLNPSACMGTGRPLISSCLMKDIDRPLLTQWIACCQVMLPSPPILVDVDENSEQMEASDTGKHGRRKSGVSFLSLRCDFLRGQRELIQIKGLACV